LEVLCCTSAESVSSSACGTVSATVELDGPPVRSVVCSEHAQESVLPISARRLGPRRVPALPVNPAYNTVEECQAAPSQYSTAAYYQWALSCAAVPLLSCDNGTTATASSAVVLVDRTVRCRPPGVVVRFTPQQRSAAQRSAVQRNAVVQCSGSAVVQCNAAQRCGAVQRSAVQCAPAWLSSQPPYSMAEAHTSSARLTAATVCHCLCATPVGCPTGMGCTVSGTRTHAHTCTYAHSHTHTRTHTHVHTHTHTHTHRYGYTVSGTHPRTHTRTQTRARTHRFGHTLCAADTHALWLKRKHGAGTGWCTAARS
jgi:hypothetical protein